MTGRSRPRPARLALLAGCLTVAAVFGVQQWTGQAGPSAVERQFGVAIEGVRLSAVGHILDFRYKVLDPDKAQPLVDRTNKAFLVHQPSGTTLAVPESPTVGPLRATHRYGKPKEGRNYVVLFGNARKLVKEGDRVTVVIGAFRAPDIVVH